MPKGSSDSEFELSARPLQSSTMEAEDAPLTGAEEHSGNAHTTAEADCESAKERVADSRLRRRTVRKLDFILLPFLALLFLLNSLDKSNIGNAETAGFSQDTGLSRQDINVALAFFFAFFVTLQPLGAAIGRRVGMARWVPACMSLWGLSTIGHIWVRSRWQLIVLRIIIASLEAGFYPTTVSYLSLFYTRYEFGIRLGIFYGQTAAAGALGGILSWAVFSRFDGQQHEGENQRPSGSEWRSWEALFLIEGCLTIVVAIIGFVWLPHSADSAWFFNADEKWWAEERILRDRDGAGGVHHLSLSLPAASIRTENENDPDRVENTDAEDETRLLSGYAADEVRPSPRKKVALASSNKSLTADSGLTREDIVSAVANYKIWLLLICNILSAIPATAFSVFLPMVMKQLSPSLSLSPAASNLLAAPPFAFGAIVLLIFTWWSDTSQRRLVPILWGLALLVVGLAATVLIPMSKYILRYLSLCLLLSGSFVASPLTVAWLSNNTPEPGKRAILLGLNGWGNLAGVFSALLFTPDDAHTGYIRPFIVTLICVSASFAGFALFHILLIQENRHRDTIVSSWSLQDKEREESYGDVTVPPGRYEALLRRTRLAPRKVVRRGDEKMTFRYGT